MHHRNAQKSNSSFYEILFVEKEDLAAAGIVPPTSKWKSLLKQLWKNLAEFPNNKTCSAQRLIHGASASKSLFFATRGQALWFPVTGKPEGGKKHDTS